MARSLSSLPARLALLLFLTTAGVWAQDTSAILSGILGSLTSTSKARGCPGECVHAITALLCDHVVDEIQCGASYLRCCVPKDFSLGGTAVETSAPLAEEEMAPATSPATAVDEEGNVTAPTPLPAVTPTAEAPQPPPPPPQQRPPPTPPSPTQAPTQRDVCPGVCVGKGLSQYCHRVLSSPSCGPDAVCCTSADGPPQAEQPDDGPPQQPPEQRPPHRDAIQEAKLPECPGSCVSPLLSILCDHVSSVHSCPTGGSCCVSATATTTEPPIPACDGRCLPPFLSGVCQKPAQLVLRTTTCPSGTICCSQPEREQRPTGGFFGPQPGPPMHQQRPPVNQQRPFGAIIPQERPYQNHPQAHDQLNAVIPVDQAMMDQLALENGGHRRPQHDHRVPQPQGRPEVPHREPPQMPQQGPQSAPRPVKQGLGPPKRLRPSPHHPPGSLQRPGPRPPSPSSMDFQGGNPQVLPLPGFVNDESSKPMLGPLQPPTADERPGDGESNALPAAPMSPQQQQQQPHQQQQQQQQQQQPQHQGPLCPGNCISTYLRFACFGEHAIHPGLRCPQEGLVCCANIAQVQRMAEEAAAAAQAEEQKRPPTQSPLPQPPRAALNPDVEARPPPPPRPRPEPQPEHQHPRPKPALPPPRRIPPPNHIAVHDTQATTAVTPSTTRAPSVAKGRRPPRPSTCGVKGGGASTTDRRHAARITGGKDSLPGEWCWQAALINEQNQYLCGGALIGTQWVLTAAHCVTSLVRNGEPVFVRVGDHDLGSEQAHPGAQTRRVATTYIHHNHNGQTLDNDIALLKLQGGVQLNARVCLVCLPARGAAPTPGERCTVTGYGYLGEGGPIALRVREAQLPIVEDRDCTAKINAVTEKQFLMPASSYCAGGEKGNDACQVRSTIGLSINKLTNHCHNNQVVQKQSRVN
ncbi:hypothetical protein V5799_024040, partial [Amblyomma americanum]